MNTMHFDLAHVAVVQKRPRTFLRLRKVRTINPNSAQKHDFKVEILAQMKKNGYKQLKKVPVDVNMTFYLPFPSRTNRQKQEYFQGNWAFGTGKDVDNMAKFYLDVIDDLAIDNDRNVCNLTCRKIYDDKLPRVEINIREIPWTENTPLPSKENLEKRSSIT